VDEIARVIERHDDHHGAPQQVYGLEAGLIANKRRCLHGFQSNATELSAADGV
jgi:hypothetical protein